RHDRRDLESEEVSKEARMAPAAGAEFRSLFSARDSLRGSLAHVGHDSIPHTFLVWVRLHGYDEFAANCRRQTTPFPLSSKVRLVPACTTGCQPVAADPHHRCFDQTLLQAGSLPYILLTVIYPAKFLP